MQSIFVKDVIVVGKSWVVMLDIDVPSLDEFRSLSAVRSEACISLYVPTTPGAEAAEKNRVAFKDLGSAALEQVRQRGLNKRHLAQLEKDFDRFAGGLRERPDDNKFRLKQKEPSKLIGEFWASQSNCLAFLASPGFIQFCRLPYETAPLAEVSDRFHLTPLIRAMTSRRDALVLVLTINHVHLLHAFAARRPVRLHVRKLPKNAVEATHRPSVHVRAPRGNLQNLEGEKVLLRGYVHRVEKALREILSGQDTPLILAAAEPLASLYRSVNSYPRLAPEGIAGSPDNLTDVQLADAAVRMLDVLYEQELAAALHRYDELKPRRATTDVSYAAHAATYGAIDQLVVDLDAVVPGFVSDLDGSVSYAAADNEKAYSVVDEVARRALATGARVLGAKQAELPDQAPLIAILRYQFGVVN